MQEKGRTVFSSSSEKTKISNHLQISEQRYHILFSNFKTVIVSVGPVRGVNYRPPTQQYGALLNDLTIFSYYQPTLTEFQVSNILNGENVSAVIDNWSSNVRRRQSNDTPLGLFSFSLRVIYLKTKTVIADMHHGRFCKNIDGFSFTGSCWLQKFPVFVHCTSYFSCNHWPTSN